MTDINSRIQSAVDYIRSKTSACPSVGLVLGSGLGEFAGELEEATAIPFADIPGFPVPTVEGHAGQLAIGLHNGHLVAALSGRVHYYEGLSQREITIPVRVLQRLGVSTLMLTNAAGGINQSFGEGALMMISDHINFSGQNPLIGPNLGDFGPRFPDMTDLYTASLRDKMRESAKALGITLQEGVYAMCSGPSYETPAEVRMLRTLGADAVGMSTAPEAIVARHAGMQVLGISCITNMAAGLSGKPLNHAEVVETAARVKGDFKRLVSAAIGLIG